MLIEQAFFNLPEVLVGARYPLQDYEAGIVGAFSMSLLQELNGRNVNNPLSHLSMEHPYGISVQKKPRKNAAASFSKQKRPLRADLHVRLDELRTGSWLLASYGWRHSNWIEAKFFRKTKDGTKNVGLLLADIIRLITLPEIEKKRDEKGASIAPKKIAGDQWEHRDLFTGRYLLHVYQGRAEDFVSLERNDNGARLERTWVKRLQVEGPQLLDIADLDREPNEVMKRVGVKLKDLKVHINVTNLVIKPTGLKKADEDRAYQCILTRFDSFTVAHAGNSWEVTTDRRGLEKPNSQAFSTIREFVGSNISLKESEKSDVLASDDPVASDTASSGAGTVCSSGIGPS